MNKADDGLVALGEAAVLWLRAKREADKACKVYPMMKYPKEAIARSSAREVVKAIYAGAWVHGYRAGKKA